MNSYTKVIRRTGWLASLLLAAACSAACSTAGPGGNTGNAGAFAAIGEQTGSPCPGNNLTQVCSCTNGNGTVMGRQTCAISSGWGGCECAGADNGMVVANSGPASNKKSVTFDWQETVPGSGSCKAGHYAGVFDGFYNSPVMVASPVGIPLVGTVEFDLFQIGNGEFFEIRDGKMDGFALGFVPYNCDIKGTIDCGGAQPTIEAFLKNGNYFVVAFPYIFDGKIVGLYDKANATIGMPETGQWAVTEPTNYPDITRADGSFDATKATFAPLPSLSATNDTDAGFPLMEIFVMGGAGNWNAAWTGPATGGTGSTP